MSWHKLLSSSQAPTTCHGSCNSRHSSQFMISKVLLMGLNLAHHNILPQTISTLPILKYHAWVRQDQFILNALLWSIHHNIIPFIAWATTSQETWKVLASTYATPSRGGIKQFKANFKALTKGSFSISDFIYFVKAQADELALLGALIDGEDDRDKNLEELGDDYKELVCVVQARDNNNFWWTSWEITHVWSFLTSCKQITIAIFTYGQRSHWSVWL